MNPSDQNQLTLPKTKLGPKSSLSLNTNPKNPSPQIQYIKETEINDDNVLSDQEKQQEINKLRDQYIQEKLNRKKQLMKIKRQEFGSSSSQDDDVGAEESESGNSEEITNSIDARIHEHSDYQQKVKDQTHPLLKPQKVYHLKGKQTWSQVYLILKQLSIFLNQRQVQIHRIHKIKSIPQIVQKNSYKLKLSYLNQEIMLAAAAKQYLNYKKQKLSLHYIVFASIIMRKLQMMGVKFYPQEKNVPGVPESIIKNCSIYGKIYKKSQILGRWEERLIVINKMGIYSYKRFNQQHSMFIAGSTVKEIWTRFEIVDQNLLVIKVLHSSNTKTEFGIPITDFLNEKNWLYQLYQLGLGK